MTLCDRELQKVYREFNRKYFSGNLPVDIDIIFAPTDGCYGFVLQEEIGWLVTIDPRYSVDDRMWRLTLLHELAHISVHPYKLHGKKFQDEMKRLALAGAMKNLW